MTALQALPLRRATVAEVAARVTWWERMAESVSHETLCPPCDPDRGIRCPEGARLYADDRAAHAAYQASQVAEGGVVIYVSQQDIDRGLRGNPRFCPVALAMHRHGYFEPQVNRHGVRLGTGIHLDLPDDARRRIEAWDQGYGMRPFSFEMAGKGWSR